MTSSESDAKSDSTPQLRIQLVSDLHLEFEGLKTAANDCFSLPETDADVIVLAGDIGNKFRGAHFAYRTARKHRKPGELSCAPNYADECSVSCVRCW